MQPIGAIVQQIVESGVWPRPAPSWALTPAEEEPEQAQPPCPVCRGAGWYRHDVQPGHPQFGQAQRCTCAVALHLAQAAAGLTDEQRGQTFAAFRDRPGIQAASAAACDWAEQPEGWLVLLGGPGTGKSHLLAAVANRLIERGHSPRYWAAVDLLAWLRAGFDDGAEPPYQQRLDGLTARPLLLLDDIGAERSTDWAVERWQELLDGRYRAQTPTVIASNLTPALIEDRLGERIASRLRDRRLCRVRGLSAEDYRPLLAGGCG